MSTNTVIYSASDAIACGSQSLASSSSLIAGHASAAVDNSGDGALDRPTTVMSTVGTSPTTGTVIEVWVIPMRDDTNWPDSQGGAGFDGTDKAVTASSRASLTSYGKRLAIIPVDLVTSNHPYFSSRESVAALFGICPPKKYQYFITHNTGVPLDPTAGNHVISEYKTPIGS